MMQSSLKIRTARNLAFVSLLAMSVGWLGILLNRALGGSTTGRPGLLVWLVTPGAVCLLLRTLGRDGWRDLGLRPRLRTQILWYALSILIYPAFVLMVLSLLRIWAGPDSPGVFDWRRLARVLSVALATNLWKNVLEESAWRGYLTPKLDLLGTDPLVNHLFVGVIWSAWYVPYWLGLMNRSTLARFTLLSFPAFVLLNVIGLIAAALLYGEIRLLTGAIWPPVLLHTLSDALAVTLILDGHILVDGSAEVLFAPSPGGLVVASLTVALGLGLLRHRLRGRAL
jgi:membrane protease YdiL (CAAX protease family)